MMDNDDKKMGFQTSLQPTSREIWHSKYRLKDRDGVPLENAPEETLLRVAKALADVENPEDRPHWEKRFHWALKQGAIPAGRILANAGAGGGKPAASAINCTVSGAIEDSLERILHHVARGGMTLKAGCGIGYDFSTLRPQGASVAGAGASTSGPLSFMKIFDATCGAISSAGGRRGAQMGVLDISHPDIEAFIQAKRQPGRFTSFNLSCLITAPFVEAVIEDREWPLTFPASPKELTDPETEIVWRPWPVQEEYEVDGAGQVACRVHRRLPARRLWDLIMASTYDYAEPGFILIDRVNAMNNLWFCEEIRCTNPCGEQPLPPHGACLLGSINLTRFVRRPFSSDAHFDWAHFREVVKVFTRMLDNVVEIHGLPLDEQAREIERKRRHGMGFLGLGSSIVMLNMKYGDDSSIALTEKITREIAITGFEVGIELAKEKGPAPVMEEIFEVTGRMLALRPEMREQGFKAGDAVKGKVLMSRFSRYLDPFPAEIRAGIEEHGCRFTHHTSIAPTGTIALSLGNNASNGIEPSFAHKYSRNVMVEGRKSKEKMNVFSFELLAYRTLVNPEADPFAGEGPNRLPETFLDSEGITPEAHLNIQAAAQKWIDSSISKTINAPTDFPLDEFKKIYLDAYDRGLKGCTTFRYNPEVNQGVLVRDEDLAGTVYAFTLEDGSVVEMQGDQEVEYDDEIHTAANLYEALAKGAVQ